MADYIIRRLASGASPQDVILAVSERTGTTWPEAEALVTDVLIYRDPEIGKWQLLILAITGLGTVLGGLWVGYDSVLQLVESAGTLLMEGVLPLSFDSLGRVAWIAANLRTAGEIILGSAMVAGGCIGIYWAVRRPLST